MFSSFLFLVSCTDSSKFQSRSIKSSQPEGAIEHEPEEAYDIPAAEEVEKAQKEIQELFPDQPMNKSGSASEVLKKYKKVYPSSLVPNDLLREALLYFDARPGFKNRNFITIVDYAKPSWEKRMFIINMKTGGVHRRHVAHASGSDPDNDGYLNMFSNINGSHKSARGFYRVAEDYYGKYGRSARLDGLSTSNSNARARAIVLHGSDYVIDKNVKQGRSWGCFTISWNGKDDIVDILQNGSLLYSSVSVE